MAVSAQQKDGARRGAEAELTEAGRILRSEHGLRVPVPVRRMPCSRLMVGAYPSRLSRLRKRRSAVELPGRLGRCFTGGSGTPARLGRVGKCSFFFF